MRKLALFLPVSFCVALLSGCGVSSVTFESTTPQGHNVVNGSVYGGQQPISGATVQLYTVGSGGNGSAAVPMVAVSVLTGSDGSFTLSPGGIPLYSCTHSTDQVYITASGGNPGLSPSTTNNQAAVMMAALGNCGNLTTGTFIQLNEVTTAAAAWALAPFATSPTTIGASATNATDLAGAPDNGVPTNSRGLPNAMLDAQLLANTSTGLAATLPSNLTVEPGKLYALADILSTCVNSDGTVACQPLFSAATPTGGTAPTDIFTAALDIVKNPGQNPGGVFGLLPGNAPFPTVLTEPTNDWTITLSVTGGGINSPAGLDIDRYGNVWVADYTGALSEFSPQGAALSPNTTGSGSSTIAGGYGAGSLAESYGLTVDIAGNVWVTNQQSSPNAPGSVSKFTGSGAATPGTIVRNGSNTNFYDASLDFPDALSAAPNGDIFIGNNSGNGATLYNVSGSAVAPTGLGASDSSAITAVAADSSNGVWLANSAGDTVTHVNSAGAILSDLACCDGANGIAIDSNKNAWITNYFGSSFSVVSSSNTASPADAVVINGGVLLGSDPVTTEPYTSSPAGIAVDAGQNVWVANYHGQSITSLAGIQSTSALGTMISPATGYGYPAGDPNVPQIFSLPDQIVADASGNVWVSDYGNNKLAMFFGLATPTKMPVSPTPTAP
jgi:hypothetical protein